MRNLILGAAATVAALGAVPAAADVKAGVDAWSRGDYASAIDQWRPLAIAGDADAQFNLAQAYKLGRGVTLDPALAESWFRKAALQGHVDLIHPTITLVTSCFLTVIQEMTHPSPMDVASTIHWLACRS